MEALLHDLRYAARQMLRQPVFATVVVVILAIGIGANTAIFSVVNAVLIAPLPLGDPDRLVWLVARAESGFDISVSLPNYYDWEARNTTFDAIGAMRLVSLNLTGDPPERLQGRQVVGDYFGALGRTPARGRPILAEETARGAERLAVISHAFWQRRFDATPEIVGETLILNGNAFTIIGVMPTDFFFGTETDVWIPMGVDATLPWENRGNSPGIYAVAHMRSGVTLDQIEADMTSVGRAVQQDTGWSGMPTVTTVPELFLGDIRPSLLVLFGAVAFVLLIACTNIANLLLARGETRQREVAVRAALGAGRGRIIRQLLTESLMLSLIGGVLGTLLALWGVDVLVASLPVSERLLERVAIDGSVLGFTLVLSVVTGLVFGLLPALQATRTALHRSLKEGTRTGSSAGRGAVRKPWSSPRSRWRSSWWPGPGS